MAKTKPVKIPCTNCGGGPRNHAVLKEHEEKWRTEDDLGGGTYQICRCLGCETVRFRAEEWDTSCWNHGTNEMEPVVTVYPEAVQSQRQQVDVSDYPDAVARISQETIRAFNAGAMILAGGGLRAIVEAICLDRKVSGRNLKEKIDALVASELLAKPQAELLHEERYIGNSALHEILPPTKRDLEDGLAIVEGLLNTIYTLPGHAERLRRRRQNKTQVPKESRRKP